MSQTLLPGREILERFKVQLVAPLGGRLNEHWLVESGRSQYVLRRWATEWATTIDYELRLLVRLAGLGWPVASAVEEPVEWGGAIWSLSLFLRGQPDSSENLVVEQRNRGRLMARLHADMASLDGSGQRGAWRRCEQILEDVTLDRVLGEHEREFFEEVRILRWHLERARVRIAGLGLHERSGIVIHGDFARWNLLFEDGQLSGILDFELAHWDHRVGDFALSWRGKYDEVVYGYDEVAPLSPEEWELITPLWWAFLIEQACRSLKKGDGIDEWSITKLLQRSPLMGSDSADFR